MLDVPAFRRDLLAWYDAHARALPWRSPPRARTRGEGADPYRVWLSEVMLQQTTVSHATPYFLEFVRRWPTVEALAGASDAEVMAAWAGLGYYARARNLLACARAVAIERGGVFPDTEAGLRALPGIGDYTAAAVAAIAFDRPANVVDGTVERVVSRIFAVEAPLPSAKAELKRLAAGLVADERPGDWAQALMDHGAMICRPRQPLCERCPISRHCAALARGEQERFPRRSPRSSRPRRHGIAWLVEQQGRFAVVRRPATGLLGGMLGLPTSEWREAPWSTAEADALAPFEGGWRLLGEIDHVFTHFALTLTVFHGEGRVEGDVEWVDAEGLRALPSVFLKAARLGLSSSRRAPGRAARR